MRFRGRFFDGQANLVINKVEMRSESFATSREFRRVGEILFSYLIYYGVGSQLLGIFLNTYFGRLGLVEMKLQLVCAVLLQPQST